MPCVEAYAATKVQNLQSLYMAEEFVHGLEFPAPLPVPERS